MRKNRGAFLAVSSPPGALPTCPPMLPGGLGFTEATSNCGREDWARAASAMVIAAKAVIRLRSISSPMGVGRSQLPELPMAPSWTAASGQVGPAAHQQVKVRHDRRWQVPLHSWAHPGQTPAENRIIL